MDMGLSKVERATYHGEVGDDGGEEVAVTLASAGFVISAILGLLLGSRALYEGFDEETEWREVLDCDLLRRERQVRRRDR